MNKLLHRSIKVITSLLTVCMVILASCVMPALAAVNSYKPADYVESSVFEGNEEYVNYSIPVNGLFRVQVQPSGTWSGYVGQWTNEALSNLTGVTLRVFPLGVQYSDSSTVNGGCLDVTDFKSKSIIDFSTHLFLDLDYSWFGTGPEPYTLVVRSFYRFYFYDASGKYVAVQSSSTSENRKTLVASDGSNVYERVDLVSGITSIEIPDNASFVVPMMYVTIALPNPAEDDIVMRMCQTNLLSSFDFSIKKNYVIENSETLQAIEDHLGDLNDKADTIIDGSDEMQDDADRVMNEGQDLEEQLDQAMQELEDLEDLSGQDLDGSIQSISDFLRDGSWFSIINLIQPIMEFPPVATILTVLVAFINISILFFGR